MLNLLKQLGIASKPGCECRKKAKQMDDWGVEGCKANREVIIGGLKANQGRWGWTARLRAAALAVVSGVAFRLNPLDPFPGLVDEAIRRAEAS